MRSILLLLLLMLISCAKDPFLTDDSGTFKDSRDQHEYKWVRIGEQIWMAENLAFLPEVSPANLGSTTSPYYYINGYNGNSSIEAKSNPYFTTYGVLYNWEAALAACPSDWHLPSDEEWKVLEQYLGMSSSDVDAHEWRHSGSVGDKLKEAGTLHWWSPNTLATNISGFTALPSSLRFSGGTFFGKPGAFAYFWTSSEYGSSEAWYRYLHYIIGGVARNFDFRSCGISIRCLKD